MATDTKMSFKKYIHATSNFTAFIPSHSIWQIMVNFAELNSKGVYQSSENEKENCCLMFTSVMHASHVCSQYLFGLPLRTQFDHAHFDLLPLLI